MKSAIYGQDEQVAAWVAERVKIDEFGPGAVALGLVEDEKLIAGVVFNMYTKASICMHVAAEPGKRWMTKDFLWRSFAYPFVQLSCNRITGLVRVDNFESQRFVEHLGFKREGLIRRGCVDGTDMILYGILREECRFLRRAS